ncbi:MAG: chemotaxis protein CheW [Thermodesulfovibrionales bacterium]
MKNPGKLVAFAIERQRYALYLSAVEQIVRAVEITSLPKAPEIVAGVINLHGRVIPVLNIRRRFRLPEREISSSDQFIIARTSKRTVALCADDVSGVIECPEQEVEPSREILPHMEYVEGVVKLDDGIVLIHDLDTFLSLEEEKKLDKAVDKRSREEKR